MGKKKEQNEYSNICGWLLYIARQLELIEIHSVQELKINDEVIDLSSTITSQFYHVIYYKFVFHLLTLHSRALSTWNVRVCVCVSGCAVALQHDFSINSKAIHCKIESFSQLILARSQCKHGIITNAAMDSRNGDDAIKFPAKLFAFRFKVHVQEHRILMEKLQSLDSCIKFTLPKLQCKSNTKAITLSSPSVRRSY